MPAKVNPLVLCSQTERIVSQAAEQWPMFTACQQAPAERSTGPGKSRPRRVTIPRGSEFHSLAAPSRRVDILYCLGQRPDMAGEVFQRRLAFTVHMRLRSMK